MRKKMFLRKSTFLALIFQLLIVGYVPAQDTNQEELSVSGVVLDENNLPLPYVNVYVKGTETGTMTDDDGEFSLLVAKGKTISFSYVGYVSQEIVVGDGDQLMVSLQPDSDVLSEVVVTALGIKREKKSVGYAIQTIKAEELAITAEPNLVKSLSGKAAGVFITGGTSGMGGSSNITIRGNTNLSGNNLPLFVIDGVPFYNEEVDKQSFWDGWRSQGKIDWGDPISKVNPEDIEEISILKGASSTALYGSRAANGVILITTKKGKGVRKGVGIDYSYNATFSNPVIRSDFQTRYGAGNNGIYEYTGDRNNPGTNELTHDSWGPQFDGNTYLPQFGSPKINNTLVPLPWLPHKNNVEEFLRTGIIQDHNVSVSFGGEAGYGRISLKNSQESGMTPETDESRTSVNSNLLANLSDKWKAEMMVNYIESSSDNRVPGWGTGITQNLMRLPINYDIRYINSVPHKRADGSQVVFTGFDNPYWILKEDFNSYKRRNVVGRIGLRYTVNEWMEAKVSISKTINNTEYRSFSEIDLAKTNSGNFYDNGAYSVSANTFTENNYDLLVYGKKDFSEDFDFSYTLGANKRETYSNSWNANVQELATPGLATLNNGLGDKPVNQGYTEKETQSIFGLFSVGYRDYLYLDVTGRNDWSSVLPKENRSYFYPSTSLSLLFSEALNLKSDLFNYGKLRASWAQVGSDTAPYQLSGTFGSGLDWDGQQTNSFTTVLPPTSLKPQRTNSIEFGTELNFFNNRFNIDFAYYKTNTRNQIVTVGIPRSSGFSRATINAGDVQNKGVELMLNTIPVKAGDFQWNLVVNASKNENKLVDLHEDIEFIRTGWSNLEVRVTEGEKYGEIYGYSYVKNPEGKNIIMDDGRPYRSQDYPDMDWDQYLGNAQPDWLGGVTNSFRYKNLRLSSTISARFGGKIYSMSNVINMNRGLLKETVGLNDRGVEKRLPVAQGGGVRAEGVKEVKDVNGNVTGYVENDTYMEAQAYYKWVSGIHQEHLFDASYIKLQDVSISYRLSKKQLEPFKYFKGASLSLVGYNLAVLKSDIPNLDPEVSLGRNNAGTGLENGALPAALRIGFKVNVKF
ncbi:SusC/RagA family TonB-linked outer membrane protein [Arenibacter aquaticus]|uniref:SusC/RagA family TonB-linked outer membrane protein n=1 Tax=Arenibacter aquaticus TaxID=2489054 RepID=A0A3S0BXM5_9FLAO|nr:SusC/RagA family TonB-linked outer membrane protein [Arenibacter aquaticus]RTE53983.1 SusC/RagA family TonB-linked outer membrane protein [Arenibacter aquaticus]